MRGLNRTPCWLLAIALLLPSCRPADAPKEPTDPQEPQVSTTPHGGVGMAISKRGQAIARL